MLKVYVVGLVYFDGCNGPERRAYAPDGRTWDPPHFASLWIRESAVNWNATTWESTLHHYDVQGGGPPVSGNVREFRVPDRSTISFPDTIDPVGACNLDAGLPKLKKKQNPGAPEVDFDVDPANAEILAQFRLRGGNIAARRFGPMGLVEWTITNHAALQISVVVNGSSDVQTITISPSAAGDAEVVFANMHVIPDDANKDDRASDHHIELLKRLNLANAGVILLTKPPGSVGQLDTDNLFVRFLRSVGYSDGSTPNCCPP